MTDPTASPELLLAHHAGALRRLARQLVRDPDEADDMVQEVWLRALRSPPPAWDRVRGWLETVLRNIARRRARQRQRRRQREQRAARAERLASAADVVARRQTLRALTDAVLALDATAQQLVMLRYFEDLPARQVARRTGLPIAAVYRGLERARRALRRQLAARAGEDDSRWRRGLVLLCGLPDVAAPAAAAGLGAGVLLMTTKKIAVLACALALLALLAALPLLWRGAPAAAPARGDVATSAVRAPADALSAADGGGALPREELAGDAPAAATVLAPYEFELAVLALDEDDLPAANIDVWVGPERHDLNRGKTGDDGIARLRWRGRVPAMGVVYASPRAVLGGNRLRRVHVRAGEPAAVALRVATPRRFALRVEPASDGSAAGGVFHLSFVYDDFGAERGSLPSWVTSEDGVSTFVLRTLEAAPEQVVELQDISGKWVGLGGNLRALASESLAEHTLETLPARLAGRVLDAAGRPVEGALVVAGPEPGRRSRWTARTGADGSYLLEGLPVGTLHVRAGGRDHGLAQRRLEAAPGETLSWDAHLDRGLELRTRLTGAGGEPLAGWRVEIEPVQAGAPWIDGATTDAEGRCSIPNVQARGYVVRAFRNEGAGIAWISPPVWPTADEHAFALPAEALGDGVCVVRPRVAGPEPLTHAWGRLWRDDLDEGLAFEGQGDGIRLDHVPAGAWRALVGGPGLGFADVGLVQIVQGGAVDVHALLDEPSSLALLDAADATAPCELLFVHEFVCSRAAALDAGTPRCVLPPGRYVATARDASCEITVQPGHNELALPRPR